MIGRLIATRAPKTGITVTLMGVVAAIGFANPYVSRLMSIDLVDFGYDPNEINEVWDNPSPYTAVSIVIVFTVFLVALIAGIAIIRTRVAPVWAGAAIIAWVPVFITAQAGYQWIEVTYPLANLLFLVGVAGTVQASRTG